MDDLPIFVPIQGAPALTDEDIYEITQSNNPEIVEAEALCRAGDMQASSALNQLSRDGIPAEYLQICLHEAVRSGNTDLVQQLLELGVPITMTVIRPAMDGKLLDILSLFIYHGWDINKEMESSSPPPLALALADPDLVSWFLANGANPDATCQLDITPLSLAVEHAPLPIIKSLLARAKCPRNGQLLHHASRRTSDDCKEVVCLVLESGQFQVNDIMYWNHAFSFEAYKCVGLGTALHEAARMGRPEVIRELLKRGADPSIRDTHDHTALELAEISGNQAVAQSLLEECI